MYEDVSRTCFFPSNINKFVSSDKKNQIAKILPLWAFVAPKCQQNVDILQHAWTLKPNKFWIKCLRSLIFTQTTLFHHKLISTWLQLSHSGSSNLLKNFSKLNFFGNFKLLLWKKKWIKFLSLVNLHHFVEQKIMKPEKMQSLSEVENRIYQLQNATLSLF